MYEIEELRSPPSALIIQEISAFLASFVRSGQLAKPLPGDDEEECWARRMSWWWLSNPFCRADSPLGVILREGGKIVGFAGFIPYDYELDGNVVPGVMASTFFVNEDHRGKAMSIILRAERCAREYHRVDGSPNDKMQRILAGLKYERFSHETQYVYVVRRDGLAPKAVLSRLGSELLRQRSRGTFQPSARFVHQPRDIRSVPPRRDDQLRRRVTQEGLAWFMNSGAAPKQLIAVCDHAGALLAYGIGVVKKARGLKVLRIVEYSSFEASASLDSLFSYAATHPAAFALSDDLDLLIWPVLDRSAPGQSFLKVQRPVELYYKVPNSWQYSRKAGVPGEGDSPLL